MEALRGKREQNIWVIFFPPEVPLLFFMCKKWQKKMVVKKQAKTQERKQFRSDLKN